MPRKKIPQQICHFVKVRKSQKQFFLPSILPKNKQSYLPNSALASKMSGIKR